MINSIIRKIKTLFDYIDFNTSAIVTGQPARIWWNADEETFNGQVNANVTGQFFEETFFSVKNQTASQIDNITPVMFAGTLGASGKILIQPAIADNTIKATYTMGIATENIAVGSNGKVTHFGKVRGVNTTGSLFGETWADGEILYVSPTTAGYLTKIKPSAPDLVIEICAVIRSHATNGSMIVRPNYAGKMVDMDDVNGTPLTTDGQFPIWDQTNKYFDFIDNINNYTRHQQQVIRVAKAGGDFTTIQGAYDSITDSTVNKRYTVLVAPGRYNEQLTPPDYTTTAGIGNTENTEIYYDGKVIDITTQNYTAWHNLYINCTATTDSLDTIEIDTGEHEFYHCKIEWQSATAGMRGRCFDLNGGELELEHSYLRYNASNTATSSTHYLMEISGNTDIIILDSDIEINIANGAGMRAISDESATGGTVWLQNNRIVINYSLATFGSSAFFYRMAGNATDRYFNNNQLHMHKTAGGATGTGTCIWVDNGAGGVFNSSSNEYLVDGFGSTRVFQNKANDIINSYNDTIDANNFNIAGTLNIDSSEKTAGRLSNNNQVVSKESGFGVKVDHLAPTFGWRDLLGSIKLHGVGANEPAFNVYRNGLRAYEFNNVGDEVFINFHIPHDYLPGSDIFIHAHWSHHNATTLTTGALTWSFEMSYSKGHNQGAFSASVTPTVTHNASAINVPQYQHIINEVQCSAGTPSGTQIDSDNIEIDGLILVRVALTANTTIDNPFLHFVDIHYQSTNVATKQKAPDFYT